MYPAFVRFFFWFSVCLSALHAADPACEAELRVNQDREALLSLTHSFVSRFEADYIQAMAESLATETGKRSRAEIDGIQKDLIFGKNAPLAPEQIERIVDRALILFLDTAGRNDAFSRLDDNSRTHAEIAFENHFQMLKQYAADELIRGTYRKNISSRFPLPENQPRRGGWKLLDDSTAAELMDFRLSASDEAFDYFASTYLDRLPEESVVILAARAERQKSTVPQFVDTLNRIAYRKAQFDKAAAQIEANALGEELLSELLASQNRAHPPQAKDLADQETPDATRIKLEKFVRMAPDDLFAAFAARYFERLPGDALILLHRRHYLVPSSDSELERTLHRLAHRKLLLENARRTSERLQLSTEALRLYREIAQVLPSAEREIEESREFHHQRRRYEGVVARWAKPKASFIEILDFARWRMSSGQRENSKRLRSLLAQLRPEFSIYAPGLFVFDPDSAETEAFILSDDVLVFLKQMALNLKKNDPITAVIVAKRIEELRANLFTDPKYQFEIQDELRKITSKAGKGEAKDRIDRLINTYWSPVVPSLEALEKVHQVLSEQFEAVNNGPLPE